MYQHLHIICVCWMIIGGAVVMFQWVNKKVFKVASDMCEPRSVC